MNDQYPQRSGGEWVYRNGTGKWHYVDGAETMHIDDGEHDYSDIEPRAYGVDWTNVDPVYGPARGYGVPDRQPVD